MKKLLYLLLTMPLAFAACSNDDKTSIEDPSPSVAFDKPLTPVVEGKATLTLAVKNFDTSTMADDEKIEVTVQVSGNAVDGTDYKFFTKTFLLKQKSPRLTLTVNSTNFSTENKTLEFSLVAPDGFKLGKISKTKVVLSPRKIIYSFAAFTGDMNDQFPLEVDMKDDAGSTKKADADITIPIKLSTSSTAVLGTNFEFEGGVAAIKIPKGKDYGILNINLKQYDAAKNKIIIDLEPTEGMIIGDPSQIQITMKPSFWDQISGVYSVEQQMLTKEWLDKNFYGMVTSYEGFPTLDTSDKFTFNSATGKLTPSLNSELKNFFIGESTMTKGKEYIIYDMETMMQEIRVLLIDLDNVNRDFSSKTQSSDKHAYIGIRKIKNAEQQDRLELYILDYYPTTFMLEILDFGFESTRPSAWGSGAYQLFILKPESN